MTLPGEDLLVVDGLTVRFGGLTALHDVRLSVDAGTVVGVIGPNGAGKTTLFNVICGFVRPQSGRVVWRGEPLVRHRPEHLAGLGIVRTLQGLGLFAGLTVLENVMAGAGRHARTGVLPALVGAGRSARDESDLAARARATLGELGIADLADRLPGVLPYGVRKRVALARALVAEPDLLLLDEPASGLFAELVELSTLILSLRRHMAVVLVEHHMDLVMQVCDRVVVLNFGEVIAAGTPAEIQADPRVAEAYLGDPAEEAPDA
ncbi:branched-chain amino acid transport system ATP-binding protein [Amycolatopsis pretoriensis]|uniref:Branched-chain amino acid transport system ATP-binding protein n=1 Tax=Amycolatopsis pretoriensis TaxID=218821 RepID=A0A1H5RFW0_9PSEU|nr:ABC transporter ATP-binding protein [Amycolatopsis pretoriensis]SEF36391.1 branched-chain amino acid transport system ATP-binding protein [Amycolatopsis pretoriensis]